MPSPRATGHGMLITPAIIFRRCPHAAYRRSSSCFSPPFVSLSPFHFIFSSLAPSARRRFFIFSEYIPLRRPMASPPRVGGMPPALLAECFRHATRQFACRHMRAMRIYTAALRRYTLVLISRRCLRARA